MPAEHSDVGLRAEEYPYVTSVQTRWRDNDLFGHLNNAVYYELFDTEINRYLSAATGLLPNDFPLLGVVAESGCRYRAEVAFPAALRVGIAVERLGRTSVTYRLALFAGEGAEAAAVGRWVHVYVDPDTKQPTPVPDLIREALRPLAGGTEVGAWTSGSS